MAKPAAWVLQDCRAICPKCNSKLALLIREIPVQGPGFYICFPCQAVYQIAVGRVQDQRATTDNS